MNKILSAVLFLFLTLTACQKNNNQSGDLLGSWKLMEVYDKTTATQVLRPSSSNMDVVLTFLSRNSFAGHTLRNTITDGTYDESNGGIIFKGFSMTKIAEDQWGGSFLTVLTACSLQSSTPCVPSAISVQGNFMMIHTSLRYDVMLKKI
jgi:hypothetical protein